MIRSRFRNALVWIALLVGTPLFSELAQGEGPSDLESICRDEVKRDCSFVQPSTGDNASDSKNSALFRCLLKHESDASPACREQLKNVPVAELPKLPPKAVPGFAALGILGLLPATTPTVSYGGWVTPEQGSRGVEYNRLTIQVPVYQDDKDTFSMSAGGTSLHFGEQHTLSGSGIPVPEDLWKVEFGGSYSRKLEDDKLIGGRISFGSASDHPFADFDVITIGASAFYSWASTERSRWMLTILFSNNNPIINYVPIPGFIYMYWTPNFVGMFGFPFSSIVWTPLEPWMFTLSVFGPTINSEIAYGNPKKIQFFTGFSWLQQSYLRENRPDPKDRLYFDEKRVPLGMRFPVAKALKSELSVGYAFDRSVYEGTRFGNKDDGAASLGNSWYAAWNLRLEF
ncbi:MAG TPA: hypothetical protein VNV63_01625 [Nitrospiria bacterium]|jgi:hypothetical protein|nr:hypothetical protein [Nitrospiria bacterium]